MMMVFALIAVVKVIMVPLVSEGPGPCGLNVSSCFDHSNVHK